MGVVTTVIPAYNAERFLPETLDSIAAQSRRPDRVILLDNCSTDQTPRIFADFQRRFPAIHCEWRRNETNIGGLANFNRALEWASETDFLHLLSADDLLAPDFFKKLIPAIETTPGRGMVYCRLQFIDEEGKQLPPFRKPAGKPPFEVSLERFLRNQAELRHLYCQSVILKTARLPSPARFQTDWLQAADVVFFAEWATFCERIVEVPEPLCLYRVHPQSATGGNLLNLNAWVMEEWRAMQVVGAMRPGPPPRAWLARQKRRCIFAARSEVKAQMMRSTHPDYARHIRAAARRTAGPLHWVLGKLAVGARDLCRYFQRRFTAGERD